MYPRDLKDRGKAFAAHATLNRLTLSKDRGRSLRHYSRLPPHAFCGNIALGSELQECEIDGYKGSVEALRRMIPVFRKRFGKKVHIILRGDGAFPHKKIMISVRNCRKNETYWGNKSEKQIGRQKTKGAAKT